MTIEELQAEIAEAVRDYRTIWPEPYALSANLQLAVRANEEITLLVQSTREMFQHHDQWKNSALVAEERLRKAEQAVKVLRRLVPERDSHGLPIDKYIDSLLEEGT